jgi:hypothetical protein
MLGVKFSLLFIPTCAIAIGGFWLGVHQTGFWSGIGWIISVASGIAAFLQVTILIGGINRVRGAKQKLLEFEQRDAELFAQGKSFDEVISRYKKPNL